MGNIVRDTGILRKDLSLIDLFALAFGTIVGVGWITFMGTWIGTAGPAGAIIAFLLGGLATLAIGLCYAELAATFPESGGEVAYAMHLFGPNTAFLCGWLLVLTYVATAAFEAISIGWVLSALFPGSEGPVLYTVGEADVHLLSLLIGLGLTAVIMWIHWRGVRFAAGLQKFLVFCLLILFTIFVLGGLAFGDLENLEPLFAQDAAKGTEFLGIPALLSTTLFWYAGFDVVAQALGERREKLNLSRMPLIITAAIASAAVFYCLVILATAMAVPRDRLLTDNLPIATAFEEALRSPLIANAMLTAGLVGLLTTWNAVFLAATRLLLALGQAKALPLLFARVSTAHGSPGNAILFAGLASALLVFFGRELIDVIVAVGAIALAIVFTVVCLGTARLRYAGPHHCRPALLPLGGIVPLVASVVSLLMVGTSMGMLTARGAAALPEWITLGTWAAVGVCLWLPGRYRQLKGTGAS